MEKLAWAAVGLIMIIAIARRFRPESIELAHSAPRRNMANYFTAEHTGVFNTKVVAIEFEEAGPILFINGEFKNLDERLQIEGVTAELSSNGFGETFVFFEPCAGEERMNVRLGDLINLTAPVAIEAYDRGLFRTPLFSPEREEKMSQAMENLGECARRVVEKFDRDFNEYSLEGDALEMIEKEFMRDPEAREIIAKIEEEFIWRAGDIKINVRFLAHEDEAIEEIPIMLSISHQSIEALKKNIDTLAINFLLQELELPQELYHSVVFER